jgi:flavin-dependent dehydrogenase
MSPFGCGWHVERAGFDRMLAEAAVDAGATLRLGSTLVSCVDEGVTWRLTLTSDTGPTTEAARILVDATGRGARVSKRLGAHRDAADALIGITAWFNGVDTSQQGFTLVEAETDGWWYSAPAGEGQMAAMLMTDGDLAGRADIKMHSAWRTRLGAAPVTASRLASASNVRGPQAFSAASHRLRRRYAAGRWLAVGDAAMAVDPISGSGVVRALRMAQRGAETVLAMLRHPESEVLQEYETGRDADWQEYLDERAMYYGVEDRWPASPFWRRRHEARQPQGA